MTCRSGIGEKTFFTVWPPSLETLRCGKLVQPLIFKSTKGQWMVFGAPVRPAVPAGEEESFWVVWRLGNGLGYKRATLVEYGDPGCSPVICPATESGSSPHSDSVPTVQGSTAPVHLILRLCNAQDDVPFLPYHHC